MKYSTEFLDEVRHDREKGLTQSDLMNKYELTRTQIRYIYRVLHDGYRTNSQPETKTDKQFEFSSVTKKSDGSVTASKILTFNSAQSLDDKDILQIFGYDAKKFNLNSFTYSMWGKDKTTGQPLVSAKINISPVADTVTTNDFINVINNKVESVVPSRFQR